MFALAPVPVKASTNVFAALISASQPACPRLPLPSRSKTTSTSSLHFTVLAPTSRAHRFMLQRLYCSRALDHLPAHFPSPRARSVMNLWRFCVPPSQSLEHRPHVVHRPRTQSFSHACALHGLVCVVSPHGFPPCLSRTLTARSR